MIPDPSKVTDTLDGSEAVRVMQHGKWRWVLSALFRRQRIETYQTTTGKIVFSPPFSAPPQVHPAIRYAGDRVVLGIPKNVTATGCDIDVIRSRGVLVLSAGPFEAVTGVSGAVIAIGN